MSRQPRRGQVLVEFALIALVLYMLLAATIEFGRALHGAQTIQQAADLMARELSRTPLSPMAALTGLASDPTVALNHPTVRQNIYDERLLVIDLAQNPGDLDTLFATFPAVNQQLRSVMIVDQSQGRTLLRYPGALVMPGDESGVISQLPSGFQDSRLRVAVPVVDSRGSDGVETIHWVSVVEEITPGAFNVVKQTGVTQPGMVGVRINYPFQAATLSGFQPQPSGTDPLAPNGSLRIQAQDANVKVNANPNFPTPTPAEPADPSVGTDQGLQPYGGEYGLGYQLAFAGQRVRPYRKLLAGQAVYRRELFSQLPGSP